jgi:MoaA/NifB/PqqE/SkfB family radical SAM enzyme/predicted phosphodiesterase
MPNPEQEIISIDGPMLVFGGPYSNLEATRQVLDAAERLGIPAQRILCTGDVVAYGADARATAELVRRSGIHVLMGNCEESLAAAAADCGCGFTEGSACDRLAAAWYAHADREIDADSRAWMAALPRRLVIAIGGRRLAVVHGGARAINRFLFGSTPARIKREEIAATGCDGVIAGHCGLPFTQIVDGKLWHNAGAIGLPANDGTPRAWYSLLVPEEADLRIEHRALDYDHEAAARKMRASGLPDGYAEALLSGLWPSCDVLPAAEAKQQGRALTPGSVLWPRTAASDEAAWPESARTKLLDPAKFQDSRRTAQGEERAVVALQRLETLWFNTGTLCNIACSNCYIESSPTNDRLVYLTLDEVRTYLDEIERDNWGTEEIGFTGGEPFMNSAMLPILEECLSRGYRVLVLTNAMRPMRRSDRPLADLNHRLGARLTVRVSLDHFTPALHEEIRGPGTFQPTLDGLLWLVREGFRVAVAGRTAWGEPEAEERQGYARLFEAHGIPVDAHNPAQLVLFPEMDDRLDVPEITTGCWSLLGRDPGSVMCARSRMVVKRREAERPAVVACTLLPYDPRFELGATLAEAAREIPLNHAHCSRFCVLGGASCSVAS